MPAEFDMDERAPMTRLVRRAEPAGEAPAQLVVGALARLTAALEKLLSRAPAAPPAPPAPEVAVTVPPRPCRTVKCTIERDPDGFARTITFTEMEM
jgi:hypothetical protein